MLIGLLALAMGGQNAVVRRLAVPDLTTTVLTLTVSGLVADTTSQSVRGRRLISVLAMLGGALTGWCLVALGRPRRAALAGGSTAGRLRCRRLRGDPPLTIAELAVATGARPAASCNRSGLWRSSLSLECERHYGKVPVAEPLIDYLLPFVSQARKGRRSGPRRPPARRGVRP